MAKIIPYVTAGVTPGQNVRLRIHKLVWINVGSGSVKSISDYEVTVDGKVDVVAYKGDLHIGLQLTDENPESTEGPAILDLNSYQDPNASYVVKNGAMQVSATFGDKSQKVAFSRNKDNDMTKCELNGYLSLTAFLEPQDS